MKTRTVRIGDLSLGHGRPLALIAGPCVIESRDLCLELAGRLVRFARRMGVPLIFKASYDKANRSSHRSFRGPGLERGLEILAEVRRRWSVPIMTDVHAVPEVEPAAHVVDVIQIPAFLCRQTDLILAAAATGKAVNIKKGQFLSPGEMAHVLAKAESAGNRRLLVTERGSCFGYQNLVADMRNMPILKEFGYPVIFDATHSVQRPGAGGDHTAGDGRLAPTLARAAVAAGCDGVFMETHQRPETALSDRDNAIPLTAIPALWKTLVAIHDLV